MSKYQIVNKYITDIINNKGYVLRKVEDGKENKFGKTHVFTIEGGQYRIVYETNVLHGVNYFKILSVTDLLKNRHYVAWRYFYKFISFIQDINSEIYTARKVREGFQWSDEKSVWEMK